jgi:hypothetical protein
MITILYFCRSCRNVADANETVRNWRRILHCYRDHVIEARVGTRQDKVRDVWCDDDTHAIALVKFSYTRDVYKIGQEMRALEGTRGWEIGHGEYEAASECIKADESCMTMRTDMLTQTTVWT